ncbi:Extracellular ligand-binding receptor [Flexistipes sinusarabici DSM 4947]|uniref:Extracellular ligand-binding receptor n=1 Tax=Flexistipes sinusarabici (strain ATCC 49648 / DSM 4947 / MAS 10) TaxID=717231 RepID=F8E6L1_FLESM|nr:ABC transporter substrate-binding protein [Flexistipes sinusarabici]AEI14848.1 Extracellular ligand-binding receptor [Flexistipes sinusarabici DSM 4947]
MKKLTFILLILVISTVCYAEIRLGALFSTTGPASFLGMPEKQTLEMLVEEANSNGGINGEKIELFLYDTRGIDAEARKKFIRLVKKDRVDAVIGPTRSGSTLAIKELAGRFEMPLISCASSDRIIEPINPFVFKVAPSDTLAVRKIYSYLKGKGQKRVAIITAQNGYGDSGRTALLNEAKKMGINIVADEKFRDNDRDMTSQLTKIAEADPDAIICWGVGPAPAIVAKNYKQLQLDATLFMSHGVASKKFIKLAGSAAEGIILPAGRLLVAEKLPDSNRFKSMLLEYKNAYEKRFDSSVSTFGGHAYDAFQIFKKAYNNSVEKNIKITEAIENIKGYLGTYGEFNFSQHDHNGLDMNAFIMLKIQNGDWQLLNK